MSVGATIRRVWLEELNHTARMVEAIAGTLDDLEHAAEVMVATLRGGGRILTCGNGGSALEAQHLASELVGHFRRDRRPLPALALSADAGVVTAIANDYGYERLFSRQLQGLGGSLDALVAFSTSGKSANVLGAVRAAREVGMKTIAFTGGDGGELGPLVDISLVVPEWDTARVQEGHLVLLHLLCELMDREFSEP